MPNALEFEWSLLPQSLAIQTSLTDCTFQQLYTYIEALKKNIFKQKRIAVFIEGGIDLCASMLAILFSGGTYVALPTQYPIGRLKEIIVETQVDEIWTDKLHNHELSNIVSEMDLCIKTCTIGNEIANNYIGSTTTHISSPIRNKIKPCDVAYIVHTSGSTGHPKSMGIS